MGNVYDKQNDKSNLRYLWASAYCFRQKRRIIYFAIFVSTLLPIVSIINKYLPFILPTVAGVDRITHMLSQIIVLVSGCVLVLQTVLGFVAQRLNIESVNLIEKYDINVFNLFANRSIMRPISDQTMLVYASRYNKKLSLRNYYFKESTEAEDKCAHFNAIKKKFEYDYCLMLAVKNFLITIWFCFIMVLLVFAFAVNSTWTESIIYIFIPSLSAIGMIATSWHNYNLKIKFLENILFIVNDYARKKVNSPPCDGPNSSIVMRSLQDAMFIHRLNDFIIPDFIAKWYHKKKAKEARKAAKLELMRSSAIACDNINNTQQPNTNKNNVQTKQALVANQKKTNSASEPKKTDESIESAKKEKSQINNNNNNKVADKKAKRIIEKNNVTQLSSNNSKVVEKKNTKKDISATKNNKQSLKDTNPASKKINKPKEAIEKSEKKKTVVKNQKETNIKTEIKERVITSKKENIKNKPQQKKAPKSADSAKKTEKAKKQTDNGNKDSKLKDDAVIVKVRKPVSAKVVNLDTDTTTKKTKQVAK